MLSEQIQKVSLGKAGLVVGNEIAVAAHLEVLRLGPDGHVANKQAIIRTICAPAAVRSDRIPLDVLYGVVPELNVISVLKVEPVQPRVTSLHDEADDPYVVSGDQPSVVGHRPVGHVRDVI